MQEHGRYSVCGEIASGSTATVFLAEDRILRRKVALKKLHPHLLSHGETVKRFQKEAVAIASLSHENIIQVYDFGQQEQNLYLAMEYVDGASLENLISEPEAVLPNLAGITLLHQLMKGLAAAHAAGIVHRDVKPSNVLIDRRGCVRIADFGIASLAEENSITRTGSYLGTPVYSSPEQSAGRPATAKTDIFSSGILFYRCFTGRLPFGGETPHAILKAILETHPRKPAALNRHLFPGLSELVMDMLAKSPEKRPTAAECAVALEAAALGMGFVLETERVRRLLATPAEYPAEERLELAARLLECAKTEERSGNRRKAMKLAARAELYSSPATVELGGEDVVKPPVWRRPSSVFATLAVLATAAASLTVAVWRRERPPAFATSVAATAVQVVQPAPSAPIPALSQVLAQELPVASVATALKSPTLPQSGGPVATLPSKRARTTSAKAVPRPAPAFAPGSASDAPTPAAVGFFMVKSNPPFASVQVDGKSVGTTPFKAPMSLGAGTHEVVLEREGCKPRRGSFEVLPGETTSLRFTLELDGGEP